ncbi:AAA family ATPase [Virgibacillus sp. SK37]|uniref:AAA family ATPase n=1 Tax=Virgibacillus sp. SK37 TaxID=403957 RepID=UPI0004D12718|nr:AAA family ATPase [Virgibacillus sp. SK37]AIF42913.1 CRISPR-associated protein Cas2 [Virgibacillus sp. SK37]
MKRLVIITVGKTHSGKSTFARDLEKKLDNSFVMDQDNHAEFINAYYKKLQPKSGTNTLKHSISNLIVDYAKTHTDFHIIVSNSNLSKKGREYLLEKIYPKIEFVRVLVHFDIPDKVLFKRVINTQRSTSILRFASSFEEVLLRQQADSQLKDVVDPTEGEAEYLFKIKDNNEVNSVIREITNISKCL